jgi:hypothetical protein
MTQPRLYINHAADPDWLIALAFARVDDGQPPDCWEGVSQDFGWLHEGTDGPIVGFKVLNFSAFDAADDEHSAIWTGPRFDAPLVGLTPATAGEFAIRRRCAARRVADPARRSQVRRLIVREHTRARDLLAFAL